LPACPSLCIDLCILAPLCYALPPRRYLYTLPLCPLPLPAFAATAPCSPSNAAATPSTAPAATQHIPFASPLGLRWTLPLTLYPCLYFFPFACPTCRTFLLVARDYLPHHTPHTCHPTPTHPPTHWLDPLPRPSPNAQQHGCLPLACPAPPCPSQPALVLVIPRQLCAFACIPSASFLSNACPSQRVGCLPACHFPPPTAVGSWFLVQPPRPQQPYRPFPPLPALYNLQHDTTFTLAALPCYTSSRPWQPWVPMPFNLPSGSNLVALPYLVRL